MNKGEILAIKFNKMVYEKTGELSIKYNQLKYYQSLNYRKITKGKHKTLGNFITLTK